VVSVASVVLGGTGTAGPGSSLGETPQTKHSVMRSSTNNNDVDNQQGGISVRAASSLPAVRFELVPSEEGVLRYAASIGGDKDGSSTPLSMAKWIRLMTHEDRAYAESLTTKMTSILLVSGSNKEQVTEWMSAYTLILHC
jgi:hypothetical protein